MNEYICKFEEEYGFLKAESMEIGDELIRCKDCKHETDHDCPINWGKTGEDFCSFAERKEE